MSCHWYEVDVGDGCFETTCGYAVNFTESDSGPGHDPDFRFCCKCGQEISHDIKTDAERQQLEDRIDAYADHQLKFPRGT